MWSPQQNFIYRWILRFNFKQADFVTATSRMLAATTTAYCPPETKVHVVPFGVDTTTFSPRLSNEEKNNKKLTVGIVKTMRPRYGIRELILAFEKISKVLPNTNLVIVGGGEQLLELRTLVENLKIESRVFLIGSVDHDQIIQYLHSFDIFVVPSFRESFGVAAVEASACGLPVIASDVGGLPEVVLDGITGLLVPPGDINALAEAMFSLLTDPQLRIQMGQAGREFVLQHYRWEDNAKLMESLYYDILGTFKHEQK